VLNGNVDGWEVTDCLVRNCDNIGIDIIGHEGKSSNASLDQARNGVVRGNTVHHIDALGNKAYTNSGEPSGYDLCADAIYVDGGKDVVIERNLAYSSDIGLEVASEHQNKATSHITVRSNMIWNNGQCGMAIGGWRAAAGNADHIQIVGNTFFRNGWYGWAMGELCIQYHTSDITVVNNLFYTTNWPPNEDNAHLIRNTGANTPVNLVIDYNLYYAAVGNPRWQVPGYTMAQTFAQWQGQGWDAHGLMANPFFLDSTYETGGVSSGGDQNPTMGTGGGLDLHLTETSPAINAGTKESCQNN